MCTNVDIKLFADSIARTYANFYLEHPDINTNLQINTDFQRVIGFCIDHLASVINIDIEVAKGCATWWKYLYASLGSQPPEELKRYLDWMDWDS
jgi:hypothetical protein